MILLRSFLSGHIRIKRALEYYDAGIGPRVPFGGGFGPTVSANFAVALGDYTTLSSTSTMPTGGSISRAGNAMLYDATGKLTYAPNNLLLWSQDFRNTATAGSTRPWINDGGSVTSTTVKAPDNTNTACEFTASRTSEVGVYQNVSSAASGTYVFRCSVKKGIGFLIYVSDAVSGIGAIFNGLTGNYINSTSVGSGFTLKSYSCSTDPSDPDYFVANITVVCGSANSGIYSGCYINKSGGTTWRSGWDASVGDKLVLWGAQLEAVTYATTPAPYVATTTSAYYGPRFDYDPVTLQPKGLLVEGTRTNTLTNSNGFSTASWTTGSASLSGTTTGPDGVSTSGQGLLADAATTAEHYIYQPQSGFTANANYALSLYVKADTTSYVYLMFGNGSGYWATAIFDLTTSATTTASQTAGGATSGTVVSTSKQSVGNGWFRIGLVANVNKTNPNFFIGHASAATGNTIDAYGVPTFTSVGTERFYLFGAQLEAASFASSYIPTVPSSVARAAETFSLAGYANRLVEAYYIDEQTGANYSGNSALSTGTVTISPPTFGWVTSLRAYQNAYAGSISSPSWLSFSRAGNAMYYDSTGTLTWAPANLLTYSQTFANAIWVQQALTVAANATTAPDGTNTASFIAEDASTSEHNINQPITAIAGYAYTFSCYLKAGLSGWVALYVYDSTNAVGVRCWFNLSTGQKGTTANIGAGLSNVSYAISSSANGFYRCSITATAFASNSNFRGYVGLARSDGGTPSYAGNTSYGVYVWGAQLEPVTYQTAPSAYIPTTSAAVYGPRYDYDPSTVPATPRGLLIEEQRANEFRNSQNFTALGGGNVLTPVLASGIAPDGTNTANKLTEDTTASTSHFLYYGAATFTGTYTASIFAKYNGRRYVWLSLDTSATGFYFDIQNGTSPVAFGSAGATAAMSYVGNGWYRCSVTQTITAKYFYFGLSASTSSYVYSGDGVSGALLWGGQIEAGAFATSYIPNSLTTGSVTRAADVAQLTGSALTTLQGANVSVIGQLNGVQGQYPHLYSSSTNTNNFVAGYAQQATSTTYYGNLDALVSGTITGSVITLNASTQPLRIATAYKTDDFNVVLNNDAIRSDVTGAIPSVTSAHIGSRLGNSFFANGCVQSIAIYNTRLPDAILKQKSSVNAPY